MAAASVTSASTTSTSSARSSGSRRSPGSASARTCVAVVAQALDERQADEPGGTGDERGHGLQPHHSCRRMWSGARWTRRGARRYSDLVDGRARLRTPSPAPRSRRWRRARIAAPRLAAVLAGAAVPPDVDVVGFRFGIPYDHPLGHRGFIAFARVRGAGRGGDRAARARRASAVVRAGAGLLAVAFIACASHGILDACTDAGLGVGFFIPFDDGRYFLPWRPVRTSPLSAAAFFNGRGLEILANEMLWIWLPTGLLVAVALYARRRLVAAQDGG